MHIKISCFFLSLPLKTSTKSLFLSSCGFKGSLEEFAVHMKNNHSQPPNINQNVDEDRKQSPGSVKIPCDICDFVAASTRMYIKHIESKHQSKEKDNSNTEYCLPCEKCKFVAKTEEEFKCHLERIHSLKVKENMQETRKNSKAKLCVYWNRGHCSFNQKCKNVHEEIPACRFQTRCNRSDCKFWHEPITGKFPFLGQVRFPQPPHLGQFARPGQYRAN